MSTLAEVNASIAAECGEVSLDNVAALSALDPERKLLVIFGGTPRKLVPARSVAYTIKEVEKTGDYVRGVWLLAGDPAMRV